MLKDLRNRAFSASVCQDQAKKVPVCLIVSAFACSGVRQHYDGSQAVMVVLADPTRLGDIDQCRLEMQRPPEADTAHHSVPEYLVNLLGN